MMDPADPRFVTGTTEQIAQARLEWHRQQALQAAMRSSLPEIPRSDLSFQKFGLIEHIGSGNFYRALRGVVDDPQYSPAVGYYIDEAGGLPVYLERPVSRPRDRAELEQMRAEREARRNAPKERPAWAKR